ncbi:MAG: tetratricopeptide repeat protein [Candidatus Promineifilaceae bacterium]
MKRKLTLLSFFVLLLIAACSSETALDRAQAALGEGDYTTAITEFDASLESDLAPADRFASLTGRAEAHSGSGNADLALADYAAALSVMTGEGEPAGDFAQVRRARVDLLFANGQVAEAAAELDELITLQPENGALRMEQANLYASLENWEAVVTTTSAAVAQDAANYEALAMRGEANLQLRNFEDAIADLKASLQGEVDEASADVDSSRRSNLADAYFRLGQAMYSLDELDEAITQYTAALEYVSTPIEQADILAERGFIYSEMNQYDTALADLSQAITLNPDKAITYSYRSYIYSDQEDYDAAIADANRAIELGSDLSPNQQSAIYHARAWAYINLGEYENAVDDASNSIQLAGVDNENAARTYNLRSQANRRLGLLENAFTDASTAIELGSADIGALDGFYKQRARVSLDMEDYAAAIADVEAAIGISEATASNYELLADAYLGMGDIDNAVSNYQSAIVLEPDNPWLHNYLGDIYYQNDSYANAEIEYRAAISIDENVSLYHENLGFALRDLEKYTEAVDAFTTSLAIDPDAQFSWFGRGHTYYLQSENDLAIADLQKTLEYDISEGLTEFVNSMLEQMGG